MSGDQPCQMEDGICVTQWHRHLHEMTTDEVRLEMVHQLHTAVYGSTWPRPQSPKEVWQMLLDRVRQDLAELYETRHSVSRAEDT
jgi:hypothetical protein